MNVNCLLAGWGCASLSSNDSAKKVQTRTELSLLKFCRVQPFFERQCKESANENRAKLA